MILRLYVMPRNENEWLKINPNETALQRCAWWSSLQGFPDTSNRDSIRISIPVHQTLTPKVLVELFDKVRKGEML